MNKADRIYATGRRKETTARVWIWEGDGTIEINGLRLNEFAKRENLRMVIRQPLELLNLIGKISVKATVSGGGESGQAGAVRHGISRALIAYDETLRSKLKSAGFLTRDPRMKERKKYGKKGARRSFQFTKR